MFEYSKHKFSFEMQYDNEISFLNISTTTIGNELQISLFWRNTFSGVYLNFNSQPPKLYNQGLIDTLLNRVYNIFFNYSNFHYESNYLNTVWQKN